MNPFPTDDIVSRFKMFWQYPVITEKTFYEQNKNNNNCLSFPWATVIDKNYRNDVIYNILKKYIHPGRQYYTCCQHISFRNLIPLFKSLGIQTVYTPHKVIEENVLSDIQLRPCPLYAVNVEDPHRNTTFKNVELLNVERKLLYSFQGAYIPRIYLTDIREKIFNMKHPDKCFVHNIGQWHFERIVYNKLQNKDYIVNENDSDKERTEKYNRLLLESRYSLCPSGSGPNSIRFWESLACGSIPVLLSDRLELPSHELWDESIVRVSERELHTLPTLLSNIDTEKENRMRENCIKLYEYYKKNYANNPINSHTTIDNTTDDRKCIFTSYKCDADEPIIQSILGKWKMLNPSIKVLYFSDVDVEIFFRETDYFETFSKMKNGVAIADFFRICYINKYGGYWFDLDITPVQLNLPEDGNIHLFDAGFNNISYMFIGGNPHQRLFNEVIHKVITNIENNIPKKHQHVMDITGPRVIQNILCHKLKIDNKDGCLIGTTTPKIYLRNTDYEFTYVKIELQDTKTNEYKLLQNKNNKMNYQYYDFL